MMNLLTKRKSYSVSDIKVSGSMAVITCINNESDVPKPGQFYMISIPGMDEKPLSVFDFESAEITFAIKNIGPFSKKLFQLKPGDMIALKGPLGNGFTIIDNPCLLIGGGCGASPLYFLYKVLKKQNTDAFFIAGGKNAVEMKFLENIDQIVFEADNQLVTDIFPNYNELMKYHAIYVCGPEIMIKKVLEHCTGFSGLVQVSLERYMKCGLGLCGSCSLDNTGDRVCCEGPVFNRKQLENIIEFGQYKRDKYGTKLKF